MGSTFRYAAVFAGESFPERIRSEVIDAIRAQVLSGPYVEVGSREEADRSVAVARVSGSRWVHVADERDGLAYDLSLFDRAAALSDALQRPVVSMSVFDSDDISMIRWEKGSAVDVFAHATHLEFLLDIDEADRRGDPTLWVDLLSPDRRPDALRRCWDTPRIGIEDMAQEAADVLGFDPDYWAAGIRTMERWPEDDDVWLHFALTNPHPRVAGPPAVRSDGVFAKVDGGPIGGRFVISVPVHSVAGPISALLVMCVGPALDNGDLSLTSVSTADRPSTWAFREQDANGHRVQAASCDPCPIPGALVVEPKPESADFTYSLKLARHSDTTGFDLRIAGVARRSGSAELAMFISPLDKIEGGTMLWGEIEADPEGLGSPTGTFYSGGDPPLWLKEVLQSPEERL